MTTTGQQPAITGNVLFYSQPEPLSPELHGKIGLRRMDRPFGFASQTNVVPLTVGEFPIAGINYPIIFAGERYQPLARRIAAHGVPAGQQAFRDYASTLIAWQRLPYLDPGLPLELLPADWSGVTTGHLFAELNGHLHEPALRHAVSVIHA